MDRKQTLSEQDLQYWLNSGDSFIEELAEKFVGEPYPINFDRREYIEDRYFIFNGEKELVEILAFLSTFTIAYREMGLFDLAETYDKRITFFIIGLAKLGYVKTKRKEYVANRLISGPLERVIRVAFGRTSYRMLELNRETEVKGDFR